MARSSYILRKSQNIPGFEETGQTITRNYIQALKYFLIEWNVYIRRVVHFRVQDRNTNIQNILKNYITYAILSTSFSLKHMLHEYPIL